MTRFFVLFLLSFSSFFSFSQRSEVVYKSKFSHNYAIGKHYYIEDAIDTSKLFFIATIRITSSNQDVFISKAHNLLEFKAKELNANSYKLKSFSLIDTTLTMLFDVYFAPEKQIDLIRSTRVKERFIYFNNIKDTIYRTVFINEKAYLFSRKKHIEFSNVTNREICFQLDTASRENKCKKMKDGEDAFFYSVKIKENTSIYFVPVVGGAPVFLVAAAAATAVALANKYVNPNQEKFTNISYSLGRLLMEIYPLDKEVILN
ncbi:MAG: hypothetical protein K0S53_73 [Bacteroidetes bacterium]|jgi:hypothetical protein|nr:hypothetical protein [Bacteroidota bacterium]MDF2451720.1 hypothetical protein [Bacteroidota bacterium]